MKWDLRKNEPYSIYDRFDFNIPVGSGEMGTVGDCWDRYIVRLREIRESLKIVRQACEQIPEGPFRGKVPKMIKPPPGEIYCRTETPRGELGYYVVSDGSLKPYRVKVKSPCFTAISSLKDLARGAMIADLVVIIGSFDIVLGEVDR